MAVLFTCKKLGSYQICEDFICHASLSSRAVTKLKGDWNKTLSDIKNVEVTSTEIPASS